MTRNNRQAHTEEEFIEGAIPIKRIVWSRDAYPFANEGDPRIPSRGPVALLDLTHHPQIGITDLARLYQVAVPGGEGPTAFAWNYWNEPGNYLARLTLAYESPVALEFSIIFRCASPDHWTYLRWVAENDGMVPLADEAAGPIPDESDDTPRTMLLGQVAGADALAIWLGGIKNVEAEAQKGERLAGLEVILNSLEGKRYLSFPEITSALVSWLKMPYQGPETLILEALEDHESIPLPGMSPQLKEVLQQVAGQENVRITLLGGIPHLVRLDWLEEMGPRDLERVGKSVRAYFEEHWEGQREGLLSPLALEEFTEGAIRIKRIVQPLRSSKGPGAANSRNMPVALLDLSQHPAVDLRRLSQPGIFAPDAGAEFSWALAISPDDILVRLTCTYGDPDRGQFAVLFSLLQHNAFLLWVLEHDNLVPLADANWMEQQESGDPQALLYAEDDELAGRLRMAAIEQTLTSMDRPPSPEEMVRILFGIRRFLSLRELATIADQMWAMPTQGSEEVRIPNVMEGPQARLRAQHLSRDFRDLLVWLLEHPAITSGLYKGEAHLFTEAWFAEHHEQPRREKAGVQVQRHAKRRKRKKGKRPFTSPERETPIRLAPAPDPTSAMGRATLEDGTRVRAYPYLYSFVRPLVPGEFEGLQVVSEERMSISTHILVARLDPTSVTRTRIPITTEQAEFFQAFGVLERDELQAGNGPFTLPEETQRLDLVAASTGVHASFLDFPRLERSEAASEARARQLAELRVRIWSDIANDREMYTRQFVPAFVFGYRLGDSILQEANAEGQARLLQGVCPMPTPDAIPFIQRILQDRMKEMQVSSMYELL